MNLKVDKSWGYLVNGKFDGIIGDFLEGTCDLSATGFYYKRERFDVLEYTVEHYVIK